MAASEGTTYFFDLVLSEGVLKDLEVTDKLVLMLRIHLDASHRYIACMWEADAVAVTDVLPRLSGVERD